MNLDPHVAEFATLFLLVNVGAVLVLALLSWIGSAAALRGLEWIDARFNRPRG